MIINTEPKLAPPGAGLPKPELYVARLLFKFRRWTGTRSSYTHRFQHEKKEIHRLVSSCEADLAGHRVLIARLPGLEDSSRYWSVWMTIDHLRIVNQQIALVIQNLLNGITPQGTASTANVKPKSNVTAAVIPEFEMSCDALIAVAGAPGGLKTKVRFAHPWFGQLDAEGWLALAAMHMGIHRAQIERILNELRKKV